jgi:DNA polymerase III subunit delta'
MSESRVLGQERVVNTLLSAVQTNRVPHAFLFYGPTGVGKRAAAIDLAASLQCRSRVEGRACGTCNSCKRVFQLGHPDVHFLMPTPKDTPVESITERLKLTADNPYATVDFERRPSLGEAGAKSNRQVVYQVERINHELRREMSFKPVEGGYRVAILTDADRMRREAANAFLKLLEEPGDRTVLILITDRPDRLLPTIRSRCQLLRFDRLGDETIRDGLIARSGLDPGLAETIARMSDGSFGRAVDLASSTELLETREHVLDFLRTAFQGRGDRVVREAEILAGMGREPVKFFLQLTLNWLRDVMLYRNLADTSLIVNIDQMDAVERFSKNLPEASIDRMVEIVDEAADLIERNINLKLVFIVLTRSLGRAMRGLPVGNMTASLSDEPILEG